MVVASYMSPELKTLQRTLPAEYLILEGSPLEIAAQMMSQYSYCLFLAPSLVFLEPRLEFPTGDVVVSPMYWSQYQNNTIGKYSLDMFYIGNPTVLDAWNHISKAGVYTLQKAFEYAVDPWKSLGKFGQEHNVGPWRKLQVTDQAITTAGLEVKSFNGHAFNGISLEKHVRYRKLVCWDSDRAEVSGHEDPESDSP